MVLKVIYTLSYIVLQVVPKVLPRTQTMISTVNNVPEYQVTAYKNPGTLSERHFEDSKVVGPEAEMSPIDPDRCSLTSLMKCIVSLYFFSIRFTLLRISSPTINYKVGHYFFFD